MTKDYKKYIFIVLIIIFLASLAFNGYWLLQRERTRYFNAGINQAVNSIIEQAKKGEVSISNGQETVALIPKIKSNE